MADYVITTTEVLLDSGTAQTGIAAEAITAGDALYKDADNSNKLTVCDTTDASKDAFDGLALTDAAAGQIVAFAPPGSVVDLGASLTGAALGDVVVLSVTGAIVDAAELASSDYPTIIGHMSTAQKITLANPAIVTGVQVP